MKTLIQWLVVRATVRTHPGLRPWSANLKSLWITGFLLVLLLCLPSLVQAQFTYTTNNGAITITGYTGLGGEVSIPDTINGLPVKSIGDSAFSSSSNLTSVKISNGVTNIGVAAFYGCSGLIRSGFKFCACLHFSALDARETEAYVRLIVVLSRSTFQSECLLCVNARPSVAAATSRCE
jgi:hypothetical protein